MTELERIDIAADAVRKACGGADVGLILGSGLGDSISAMGDMRTLGYADIPGFPKATVAGHRGEWCCGEMAGKRVALMRGRFHYYEGHPIQDVVLPVRVMARLGVRALIVTNAAGGVNTAFSPGDLMLITDHIAYSGPNPLIGANLDAFGPRFNDMSFAYDPDLRNAAKESAARRGTTLREGVYMWFSGPSFETPAEIRMARAMGADAVGMSTVPEVIVARHCGMRVLGMSCVTNMAAGILDAPLDHVDVLETGRRVRESFCRIVEDVVAAI